MLVQKNLGLRWRKRKENYEREVQINDDSEDEKESNECLPLNDDRQTLTDVEENVAEIEDAYNEIASTSSMPLLLPSVIVPITKQEPFSFAASVLSKMEQQCIIKKARDDRDQALLEAKEYRDLAERLQKEKRDVEQELTSRIETVRDFWRNKIVEGESRAGKILRASLLS